MAQNRAKTHSTRVDQKHKSPKWPPFATRIAPMRLEQRKQIRSTPILIREKGRERVLKQKKRNF
ncbi:hypothetical protein M5K25_006876 [Dendrobium thyrsiflorum]|uniref:Uncharacterized protein n=1 Tax=Dendrobium thyrsiflorum TaxID=117978 RepID=A0ABD0VCA8_DENTH